MYFLTPIIYTSSTFIKLDNLQPYFLEPMCLKTVIVLNLHTISISTVRLLFVVHRASFSGSGGQPPWGQLARPHQRWPIIATQGRAKADLDYFLFSFSKSFVQCVRPTVHSSVLSLFCIPSHAGMLFYSAVFIIVHTHFQYHARYMCQVLTQRLRKNKIQYFMLR